MALELTDAQRSALTEDGYIVISDIARRSLLDAMCGEYDRAWYESENGELTERLQLLRYPAFLEFIDQPTVLAVPRAIYGKQLQLLDYWLTFQPSADRPHPNAVSTERDWHRDMSFFGCSPERPFSLTMLVFLQDMVTELGPTVVLPGSHRGRDAAVSQHATEAHDEEVAISLRMGQALLFNSHLVHSQGRNRADQPRRGVALQWGYWFVKPLNAGYPVCAAGLTEAKEDRLRLLGVSQPTVDEYLFESF